MQDKAALSAGAGRLMLRLRVKPGASRNRVLGRSLLSDGNEVVVVSVSAPPEGGRANLAVAALVAEALELPRRDVEIVGGATARTKRLSIEDPRGAVFPRARAWLAGLPTV
jgi:hypothetical protein